MNRSWLTGQRLLLIFLLGLVFLNFPLLGLFERAGLIFDLPLLYLYIYGIWFLLILTMAWVIERRGDSRPGRLSR